MSCQLVNAFPAPAPVPLALDRPPAIASVASQGYFFPMLYVQLHVTQAAIRVLVPPPLARLVPQTNTFSLETAPVGIAIRCPSPDGFPTIQPSNASNAVSPA